MFSDAVTPLQGADTPMSEADLRAPELTLERTASDSLVFSLTPYTSHGTLFDVRVEQPDVSVVRILRIVRTAHISQVVVTGLVPRERTFVSARSANRMGYVSEYGFELQTVTLASPATVVEALTTARRVDHSLFTEGSVVFSLGALPSRASGGRVRWYAFGASADLIRCEVRVPMATAWLDADRTVYAHVQGGPTFATEGAPCARRRPPDAAVDVGERSISFTFLDAFENDLIETARELHVRLTLPADAFVSHVTFIPDEKNVRLA